MNLNSINDGNKLTGDIDLTLTGNSNGYRIKSIDATTATHVTTKG